MSCPWASTLSFVVAAADAGATPELWVGCSGASELTTGAAAGLWAACDSASALTAESVAAATDACDSDAGVLFTLASSSIAAEAPDVGAAGSCRQ